MPVHNTAQAQKAKQLVYLTDKKFNHSFFSSWHNGSADEASHSHLSLAVWLATPRPWMVWPAGRDGVIRHTPGAGERQA